MNTRHLIAAALAALSTTAALADDPTIDTARNHSTLSRSEVKAEVRQALKSGTLVQAGELNPQWAAAPASTLTRSEVKADVREALRSGTLVLAGELGEQGQPSTFGTLSRSEVKAEVLAARSRGELLPAGEVDTATLHASTARVPAFLMNLAHAR